MKSLRWQEQAKCLGVDPEIFFLPNNARMGVKRKKIAEAKRVCVGCPVTDQCLDYALSLDEQYGVWGGMSPEERNKLAYQKK